MDIKEKLTEAMRQAMRANDDVARRTTRMVLAAIKLAEVEKQAAAGRRSGHGAAAKRDQEPP